MLLIRDMEETHLVGNKTLQQASYECETVNCPLCDSGTYDIYIKNAKELYNNTGEVFDVVKCQKCDFIFTNPRPTKETVSYFYPDSAGYYQPVSQDNTKSSLFKKGFFNAVLKHCYNYEVETPYGVVVAHLLKLLFSKKIALMHIPDFVKEGKLLDIGCSWGGYLSQMQRYGWDVYGTEINEKVVKYAHEKLNLKNVRLGFFENIAWKQNFFDVVHMNMVLEHLYEPLLSLRLIYSVMKSKGQLILSVPDISGVEARLYKGKAYTLQVPQHLSHFSPKTITDILSRTGFRVEKIVHHRFDRDLVASADYLENKLVAKILHNKIIRKTLVRSAVYCLAVLGKTSRMSVYARKV